MAVHTFECIDAHTCGNPVRVVTKGGPDLHGSTMSERRQDFLSSHDWIRRALMFEPRGHDMMSGSILYPPTRPDADVAILFIETSGCLPMCGHGTIGTVTVMIEHQLVHPREHGVVRLDTPAGLVTAHYRMNNEHVEAVRLVNIPSFLAAENLSVTVEGIGELSVDVAYGGNFYAIIDAQKNFRDMADYRVDQLLAWSPAIRRQMNERYTFAHPDNPTIRGLSHVMWTGAPTRPEARARNAVFYGDRAIDRSPCGTGTSARMAQWFAKEKLHAGDSFVHESIIGSLFHGRVESEVTIGNTKGIVPSIEGWAIVTGYNKILVDERDPFAHGFQVT
jgi:4-hydroxyproline epimerase